MNDETPEPEKIISIFPDDELELQMVKRPGDYPCCGNHKLVTIDSKNRTVTCNSCGFTVDAFDYLLSWAQEGDRRMSALKNLEAKARIYRAECGDLRRKCDNLRGRLKRAGFPQPEVERDAYNSQRWNVERQGVGPAPSNG